MCTSPWEKFVERCFEACFRLSVARWAGVFLRLRSVEAIVRERLRMQKKKQNPANCRNQAQVNP